MEEHQQEQHQARSSLSTQGFTLWDNKQNRKQEEGMQTNN